MSMDVQNLFDVRDLVAVVTGGGSGMSPWFTRLEMPYRARYRVDDSDCLGEQRRVGLHSRSTKTRT